MLVERFFDPVQYLRTNASAAIAIASIVMQDGHWINTCFMLFFGGPALILAECFEVGWEWVSGQKGGVRVT